MASSNKRKTTMAKLNRERKLLERRAEKQARKVARKQAAADARANGGRPLDSGSQLAGQAEPVEELGHPKGDDLGD